MPWNDSDLTSVHTLRSPVRKASACRRGSALLRWKFVRLSLQRLRRVSLGTSVAFRATPAGTSSSFRSATSNDCIRQRVVSTVLLTSSRARRLYPMSRSVNGQQLSRNNSQQEGPRLLRRRRVRGVGGADCEHCGCHGATLVDLSSTPGTPPTAVSRQGSHPSDCGAMTDLAGRLDETAG